MPRAAVVLLLFLGADGTGSAHVLKEAPWHPVAKAYLTGIFMSDLKPIDWAALTERFQSAGYADQGGKSVYALLQALEPASGADHAGIIRRAIQDQDRETLRAALTHALAAAIDSNLKNASEVIEKEPSSAVRHVAVARSLFRAFEMFVRQAEPEGYRRLGLAWLDLSTAAARAAGPAPLRPEERARFTRAADEIGRYVAENYGDAPAPDLARRGPVPAAGEGRNPDWRPQPWLPPDANIADQNPLPRLVLNFEQRGVDERDLFLVAYGDMLFDSPEIMGGPARSLGIACSTCHNRGDVNRSLYVPGLSAHEGGIDVDSSYFNRRANDMRFDPIDVPSLRGIRFTAPYGRDGRMASLRDFTRNVIVNEFAGPEPTPLVLDALVAYMNEFDFLPAPLLRPDGRLNEHASPAAKRGEAIFHRPFPQMAGRSCASCHIPDANFVDGLRHDIGSVERSSDHARDGALDTPTLLGSVYTAPYFHDGSQPTLRDVVAWFDTRFSLGLGPMERRDLTAYLEAVGTGERPYESFDGENTRFRLSFGELTTFLATLDELIRSRDAFHARLLIRTVSRDLSADASGLADLGKAPVVYDMSERLEEIDRAIAKGDWGHAAELWAEYKIVEERNAASLY